MRGGRTVTVEQIAEGVWTIKNGEGDPDDELWLHTPNASEHGFVLLEWSAIASRAETEPFDAGKKSKA